MDVLLGSFFLFVCLKTTSKSWKPPGIRNFKEGAVIPVWKHQRVQSPAGALKKRKCQEIFKLVCKS